MGAPKPVLAKVREPRRVTVPLEKHKDLPSALAGGVFLAGPGEVVQAWRVRTGERPGWHACKVIRVAPDYVETIDESLGGQWFCFDPRAANLPDVRMVPRPTEKLEAAETVATTPGKDE
jgi:hypothetical protein